VAAYLFQQPRYFRLFTKRLVTDHTERTDTSYFSDEIPEKQCALIKAEMVIQSPKSYAYLSYELHGYANDTCATKDDEACRLAKGKTLVQRVTDCILPPTEPGEAWPTDRSEGVDLRRLLHGLYRLRVSLGATNTERARMAPLGLTTLYTFARMSTASAPRVSA
jgi:hypothetical protein